MDLDDITAGFDDVTDPTCMEMLMIYLEQLEQDDENFMELLLEKVGEIPITWYQPWYQESICLTRPLNHNQESKSEKFRTDSFTKMEKEHIEKKWKSLRKKFNLPDTPICLARWRNRNKCRNPVTPEEQVRHFVIAYLARGLERNLYQVYQFYLSHYGAPVRGPFSVNEEKIIEVVFQHKPSKAVCYLSRILGREPRGIHRRLQILNKGVKENKDRTSKWNLSLATQLVKSLMCHSEKSLEDLKYERFDKSIWLKVQDDLGRTYTSLQRFWYTFLHVQLFVKYDIKLKQVRKVVLKKIRSPSIQVWTDIRWKELLKHFPDGFTHMFVYHATQKLVSSYKNYKTAPIEEVIQYGLNELKTKVSKSKRLKTLTMNKEGMLEVIEYDNDMHKE
uniref:Uncharacterized protein n=1 Tax=Pectinophora gossypiella TaxID=13191 RepID=A0A1E1VYK5_PECGO